MEEKYNISDAIKYLKEGKKRKFTQSFDVIINIKNIDLKKPENKFSKDVVLPHGRGKEASVCIISDNISNAVKKNDIESMGRSKNEAKKFVKKYDFFVCETPLMPFVGKVLGRYLGPTGKMPKPFPAGGNVDMIINAVKRSVRIRLRDSPVIHVYAGTEVMDSNAVKENIANIIEETKKSLSAKAQIKNIYLKLTMSKPIKLNV